MEKPRVLVADLDESFLEDLRKESGQFELVASTNQKNTQLSIADPKARFSAICLNLNLCEPYALPLVRFVKCHRPSSPLYLMSDLAPSPLQKEELNSLHIQELIEKPVTPQKLFQILIPGNYFNFTEALEVAKSNTLKTGETKDVEDEKMHGIDAKSFLCGQKSFFDLFVRLSSGRFVMILKAGDQFEPESLLNYIKRGVTEFYIRREAQLFYLQYCDKMTEAILKSNQFSPETKVGQVMNLGGETFGYLKSAGISESTLNVAQNFVKQANYLVAQTGLGKLSEVKSFLENMDLCDHGASTVMITSIVINSMGFRDEKVTGLIAMGAFLHDIGMFSLPAELRSKAESDAFLTPEERETYESHPRLGAEILAKVPHMNPLVPQIALQHHERRTRKGFPNKLGSGAISTAAEIVGLSETFLKAVKSGAADPVEVIRKNHSDDFSLKIIDAFLKAFQKD